MSSAGVVDFLADQDARWHPWMRLWTSKAKTALVDTTGYGAQLVVVRSGFHAEPVVMIDETTGIVITCTVDGDTGDVTESTIEWEVDAPTMDLLLNPLFNFDLYVLPEQSLLLKQRLLTGRVLVRETVDA
jgi:hypothetical protein